MLRTLERTQQWGWVHRLTGIATFTLLTVFSARISIEMLPVPFTLQPLAVLLSGLVLGARDGALSQVAYLALIAAGLPVDARGLGAAAFASPTAGFLIGFVASAWTAGFIVERSANRLWQRWIAGALALVVMYLFGCVWLLVIGRTPDVVYENVIRPLFGLDLVKAFIAAALTEGARTLLKR